MRRTKISPHHMFGGSDTSRWMSVSTVAKFVGDFSPLRDAPPDVICVGRVIDDGLLFGQGFDANRYHAQNVDPLTMAAIYLETIWRETVQFNPRLDILEGPNEQIITEPGPMDWYAQFSAEFARLVRDRLGKRAGIGSWATGTPETELWRFWVRVLQAVRDTGAVLTRHDYSDINEFLGLRYRADNRAFAALGFPNLPVIITESGAEGAGSMKPWREFFGGDINRYWGEYLIHLEREYEKDEYLIGSTLFSCGDGATLAWRPYDVAGSGLVDLVIDYAQTTLPPPPEPTGDDMRIIKVNELNHILGEARLLIPLYEAVALRDLSIRDLNGVVMGVLKRDEGIYIYSERQTIGGWDDRIIFTPPGSSSVLHVWAGTEATPTLRRV